jgi:hypothetical protein
MSGGSPDSDYALSGVPMMHFKKILSCPSPRPGPSVSAHASPLCQLSLSGARLVAGDRHSPFSGEAPVPLSSGEISSPFDSSLSLSM